MSKDVFEELRRKAEEKLAERKDSIRSLGRDDLESLAHELAVHQVELEIQNEELRLTRLKAEEARDRYFDLFDFAPVAYFTVDEHNRVVEANLTGCQLLNIDKNNILKKNFTEFISPEESDKFYLHRKKMLENSTRQTVELQMRKADNTLFYAQLESLKAGESRMRLGVIDITEREKIDKALKESEDKYRGIVETANEGILIGAPDGRIIFANQKMAELLGYSLDEIIGKMGLEFMEDDQKTLVLQTRKELEKGEKLHREYRFRRKDGSALWTLASVAPQFDNDGQHISNLVMHTDITKRKKAEEDLIIAKDELEIKVQERTQELSQANQQLKQYGRRITEVQEEERKRIAYELHDDTAQYLSILKLQLDSLIQSGNIQSPEILKKLQYLEKDASRAVDDVRRYSHELRPGVLDNLGLQAALEQISDDINKLKLFTVELAVEGKEPKLSDEIKLAFFRIAQEALNNIRKHSKASNATINLHFKDSRVRLLVIDDGRGFIMKQARAKTDEKGSLGIMSMQERAKLIGADLKIESEPGKGTTVTAEVQL